jgi:hypothetical protein
MGDAHVLVVDDKLPMPDARLRVTMASPPFALAVEAAHG